MDDIKLNDIPAFGGFWEAFKSGRCCRTLMFAKNSIYLDCTATRTVCDHIRK
jgi:hypothetical protein